MNAVKGFGAQLRLSFVSALQYRADYLLTIFSVAAAALVEVALWRLVIRQTGQVRGYGLGELVVYLITANVVGMCVVNWESVLDLSYEIRRGSISRHLLKPLSLYSVATGDWLARKIPVYLGLIPVFIGLNHYNAGAFHPGIDDFAKFAALLAVSAWLSAEIYFLVILTAFWVSENEGIAIGFNVLRWGFTGVAFPLAFYPGALRTFLDVTPLPYLVYYPTLGLLGKLGHREFAFRLVCALIIGGALYGLRHIAWSVSEHRLQTVGG